MGVANDLGLLYTSQKSYLKSIKYLEILKSYFSCKNNDMVTLKMTDKPSYRVNYDDVVWSSNFQIWLFFILYSPLQHPWPSIKSDI